MQRGAGGRETLRERAEQSSRLDHEAARIANLRGDCAAFAIAGRRPARPLQCFAASFAETGKGLVLHANLARATVGGDASLDLRAAAHGTLLGVARIVSSQSAVERWRRGSGRQIGRANQKHRSSSRWPGRGRRALTARESAPVTDGPLECATIARGDAETRA